MAKAVNWTDQLTRAAFVHNFMQCPLAPKELSTSQESRQRDVTVRIFDRSGVRDLRDVISGEPGT